MIYLPSWYLLRPFDNHGLWLALLLFLAARGLTLYWIYRRQALAQWFGPAPAQPTGQA
jgi:MATE family multidrug resistance protein